MEKKKLSTQEILARARQQAAGGSAEKTDEGAPAPEASAPSQQAAPAAEESSAKPAPAAPAGGAPKSTKDILAAARAQAGGGAKPAAAAPSGGGEAKSSAAPKSTKDILAAARAQSGGGGASAPAAAGEKSAPKAGAAKAAATSAPAGDRPSLDAMLKAVREGKPIESESKEAGGAPAVPSRPQKPAPVVKKAAPVEKRRSFLMALVATPFALAWTLFTMTTAIAALATARFMMPNVLVEPPSKFKVGPPVDYPPGTVSTKWTAQFGVWIVHAMYQGKDLIYALQTVCTHLGCTPNWLEGEQKFKCPCHGSGFYITGINFEGPAPRPLERMGIRIAEDGMLEVNKSEKFQEEMGQWGDPASFVQVG